MICPAGQGLDSGRHSEQAFFVQIIPLTVRWTSAFFIKGWLLTTGLVVCALAAEATPPPNYFTRVWQVEQGLPQNKITSVVQTHDGYLWVGTYSGLARFDGVRFTVFDKKDTPGLHSQRVTSLFEAADGTLWIGHENGEVTTSKDGKFQPVTIRAAWASRKISAITADAAGDLWLLNANALLARIRDGLVLSPESGLATKLLSFARATNGAIWVARDGRLSVLEHGQLRVVHPDWPLTNSTYVQGIGASRDGGLWVASNGRIRKWKDEQWTEDLGAAPWAFYPLTRLAETSTGMLIAATANAGIFLLFPGTDQPAQHINQFDGFDAEWILSLAEDREGNLWVGSGGAGLIEMRPNHIQKVSPPDHWRGRPLLGVCAGRQGEVWVGTEGAGLYRLQAGRWTNFGATNFFNNSFTWSVALDAAGQLFVGTWGAGLFVRDDEHFKTAPGMENVRTPVPALLAARAGGLWCGTETGLLRYQDGQTDWFTEAEGKSLRDVRCIAEAADGAVWFGMAGNGLACLENGRLRRWSQGDGLPSNYINCLHFAGDGALWIGTFDSGLCRLKGGKFSVIDRAQGLPNSVIGHIEDDGHGFFWMSSHGGILRASKAELDACADGKIASVNCLAYGVNDGLPTIECSEGVQPAGCKTPDGRLWFPTSKGLVVVNPAEVHINRLPPPMALEELLVEGQRVPNLSSPLRIPPGLNRLEFHYTALSFVAPEKVSFKYRIQGLEKNWVEAGTKRVANYSFVPPGDYTFQVIAGNNDGIWNETGISLPFTVLPHFWQTWWFRFLSGLAVVLAASAGVWFETRRRLHRRLERLERRHAIEQERARIAHDIHDDLGSQLTRITMLSESACSMADDPTQAAADLNQIYDTAREATRAMDEIVWAVNPKHDTLESLASYLEKYALDFLGAAGIRCRLDLPLESPVWQLTSDARHNLFLAYKEALNNVVKHAGATEVQIRLTLGAAAFELEIADNGRGFDRQNYAGQTANQPGRVAAGNGLAGMNQRLREIGGGCEITSAPGHGTLVKFRVALAPATLS
jgi:signal transduction histidine kinase/ligand-binding sensor domain-containing protein